VLHVLLSIIIIESATNKSLACVQGIFRVLYGLDIIFKNKKEGSGASEEHRALLWQRRVRKMLTCRFATSPTKRVPSSVMATTEGVVRWPKRSVSNRGYLTFGIFNYFGTARLHDSHAGVGGSEIDTDDAKIVSVF